MCFAHDWFAALDCSVLRARLVRRILENFGLFYIGLLFDLIIMASIVNFYDDGTTKKTAADLNLDHIKNVVYERTNPNPALAVAIIAVLLLVIYLLYIIVVKTNLTGYWHSDQLYEYDRSPSKMMVHISHNRFLDTLTLHDDNGGVIATGYINSGSISMNSGNKKFIGSFKAPDTIIWVKDPSEPFAENEPHVGPALISMWVRMI